MFLDSERPHEEVVLVNIACNLGHAIVRPSAVHQNVSVDGDGTRCSLSQGVH